MEQLQDGDLYLEQDHGDFYLEQDGDLYLEMEIYIWNKIMEIYIWRWRLISGQD